MSGVPVTLVLKDYDFIAPLAAGDVDVDDVDLKLVRNTQDAVDRTLNDTSVDAGELSFSRHIMRLAEDDHSFVGIPIFPIRRFRDRRFFIRRESSLSDFAQLEGKRIGTNEWPATGNTWDRALLREHGVNIGNIDWWVGPITDQPKTIRPQGQLPDYVEKIGSNQTLLSMLLDGELDALMCPVSRFKGRYRFSDEQSPVVRLKSDYRASEKGYYRRTGLYPISHLVGIRRETFDRHPWIAEHLFEALDTAKKMWDESRRDLRESTPWMETELEETESLMGEDWRPNGIEKNRREIETLCHEVHVQGLIDEPIDVGDVFSEFINLRH